MNINLYAYPLPLTIPMLLAEHVRNAAEELQPQQRV